MIPPSDDVDVVGIYDSNFAQVLTDAKQMKMTVVEASQVMEQPLETGATTIDHRVILPVELQITVNLNPGNYRNAYEQIKSAYLQGETYSIKTKVTMHTQMLLSAMPREETGTEADLIKMLLTFKEARFQQAQFQALPPRQVANKKDASKAQRGEQAGKRESGSTLYRTIYGRSN